MAHGIVPERSYFLRLRLQSSGSREPEHHVLPVVGTLSFQPLEDMMKNRVAVSLIAVSLLASGPALAQSTTAQGAAQGSRAGGDVGGPIGAIVGGTVGAAVGAAVEIPNAVITSIPRGERSVVVERVVVGEPLPPSVQLRVVPNHVEYRYAVVNDRRVIVEPRTRKVIRVID